MSAPTRLLLFCGATRWGGAEIVLGHLLEALDASISPSLLGVDDGVLSRIADRRPGTPWTVVPPITGKRDVSAIRAHRRAMIAARPDIVQLNLPVPFADAYSVLAAVTVPRARAIVVEHLPMSITSRGVRQLRCVTARRLSAHLAVGTSTARQIETVIGLPTGSVEAVANGVPAGPAANRPVDARAPGAHFVIGAVGRLDRQKGFDVLLRALQRLPDAHLVLVGDGPERAALLDLAAALDVTNRVTITGWREDATALLESFDVVAVPSRFEGLPLVILEAMLRARAIVATPVGSISEAVSHDRTGLIVPVDDDAALAAALLQLYEDPALRERLGTRAAELARTRFTQDAMAQRYARVYARVLDRR